MSSTGSSRGNPAMGDIVRSVVVIGVVVLGLWGFGRFFTSEPESPVRAIDYATTVEQARPAADFDLLAPPALPVGWRATSARFTPTSWELGVLTDDDEYIGLAQVTTTRAQAVDRFADGSKASGEAVIAGTTWSVRSGPNGRVTLVRDGEAGMTVIVNSTAERDVVETYVESLSSS